MYDWDGWIDELRNLITCGEYPGEMINDPEQWRDMFDDGLTPAEALDEEWAEWKRATL